MKPSDTNKAYWICSLNPDELDACQKGELDVEAKQLGISGWSVPAKVDNNGNLNIYNWVKNKGHLLCALSIEIQVSLSPASEQHLVNQLQHWWSNNEPLKLWNRPILVLRGMQHLSNPQFALKRIRFASKNLIILSRDPGNTTDIIKLGFDGKIQDEYIPRISQSSPYLINLKWSHHNMISEGCWIPAVNAIKRGEEHKWHQFSADAYQEWLEQATAWSKIRFLRSKNSPVWINNWNGHRSWWSNTQKSNCIETRHNQDNRMVEIIQWGERQSKHIALMIHCYYLDQFEDTLANILSTDKNNIAAGIDLYISTPKENLARVELILKKQKWGSAYLVGTPNQGRDIAPFLLDLVPAALEKQHNYFIKIHTKQSPHLHQGTAWGQYLISTLTDPNFIYSLKEAFSDPTLALLAPKGSLLSSSVELRKNVTHISSLLRTHEIDGQWALSQKFIAGSMMAGNLNALNQISKVKASAKEFELEKGQTDGTFAHSLERMMSWIVTYNNLKISEISGDVGVSQNYGYSWIKG